MGVAEGLHYLHSQDPPIVHSDLKGVCTCYLSAQYFAETVIQANILVDKAGNPLITDFGSSWQVKTSVWSYQSENSGQGTLRYSSPEVVSAREKCTQPGDIFSFGSLTLEVGRGISIASCDPTTYKNLSLQLQSPLSTSWKTVCGSSPLLQVAPSPSG